MSYYLNSIELELVLERYLNETALSNRELYLNYEIALLWEEPLNCLSLSIARILEKNSLTVGYKLKILNAFFAMPRNLYFTIEECDLKFVQCLLQRGHSGGNNLEGLLLETVKELVEHNYVKDSLRN